MLLPQPGSAAALEHGVLNGKASTWAASVHPRWPVDLFGKSYARNDCLLSNRGGVELLRRLIQHCSAASGLPSRRRVGTKRPPTESMLKVSSTSTLCNVASRLLQPAAFATI